ncbi:hypothetical protein OG989_18810 [Micromonospora sp. NBC_01740]|uniref:hypothetical protein n=1 Tax=Micromonospora sp. NBC_01740 TaxID=2975986 RepID=UPI002E11D482|nr:hypothetical protein OG989_18810 [Micromonospora sp. NBC_01740]
MGVQAEFVRLDADLLNDIRQLASIDAYRQLTDFDPIYCLDLDRAWRRLAPLMAAASFPINPITDGSPFPDEQRAWREGPGSRWLGVQDVALAAAHLSRTPYSVLAPLVRSVVEAEEGVHVNLDVESPDYGKPLSPDEASRIVVGEEVVRELTELLAEPYRDLCKFFDLAALDGQCTIFWAA